MAEKMSMHRTDCGENKQTREMLGTSLFAGLFLFCFIRLFKDFLFYDKSKSLLKVNKNNVNVPCLKQGILRRSTPGKWLNNNLQ